MRLPKSFEELTVSQYQECSRIVNDPIQDEFLGNITHAVRLIAYLSGKTEDKVLEENTPDQIGKLYSELSFLHEVEQLDKLPINKLIICNGTVYKAIIDGNEQKAGALLALKYFEEQKNPVQFLPDMLATIYVPVNWYGKPKKYNSSTHSKIAEDFKHAKLKDVYGLLIYKKKVFEKLKPVLENYLNENLQTVQETMNWIQKEVSMIS